ncbi:zinc finger MYM-type protein 1-like [Chenopodium quinoa]|uniref:zinc finger MYM-type protein 1-like n=1 Tax=Chenopodium quinoa TaxID=63459 RepID=UPI000B78B284|nr:zinc finger MYM-type protein 1-like [Chenopodium quinoa]
MDKSNQKCTVKAIRFQAPQIKLALQKLYESSGNDAKTKSECESLANCVASYEFLLGIVILYDILFSINNVSKKLKTKSMFIGAAMKEVKEPTLPTKRQIFRKRHNGNDEELQSPEESFRVNYFLLVVDMAINSLKNIFEQLEVFDNIFGYLFHSNKLKSLDNDELKKSCINFKTTFSHNNLSDVDADDLFSELKVLQMTLPNMLMLAHEILEFFKDVDCFPNASIAYRILLTMPVTVASTERSFSKLKLLKTYLRSSMSQERLNGLATLCIERTMLEHIDVETIINDFASRNARRKNFV